MAADGIGGTDCNSQTKRFGRLRPKDKPYKVTGGDGLYILVTTQGSRLWRFDYRFGGKRPTLSLGKFPDVGLADARLRHAEARGELAQGRNPSSIKQSRNTAASDNFAAIAAGWLTKRKKEGLAQATIVRLEWFVNLVAGDLGHLQRAIYYQDELFKDLFDAV